MKFIGDIYIGLLQMMVLPAALVQAPPTANHHPDQLSLYCRN